MPVVTTQESTQPVNTPAAEPAIETPKVETPDPRFEHLAKKERLLRQQAQQMKLEKETWLQERQRIQQELEAEKAFRQKLKKAPLAALEEDGITYDKLTESYLSQPSAAEQKIASLEEKIQGLEKGQETAKSEAQKQIEAQTKQALAQMTLDVKALVNSNPDTYELIKLNRMEASVTDVISDNYYLTLERDGVGEIMDMEAAAKAVESYLEEETWKAAQAKKIQAKWKPAAPEVEAQPTKQSSLNTLRVTPQAPIPKTLTHQTLATPSGKMTDRERRERAILAFQGKLA